LDRGHLKLFLIVKQEVGSLKGPFVGCLYVALTLLL